MAKKPEALSSTIFSLNKRILPSEATMYGASWEDRENPEPLKIEEKTVRGSMSHHLTQAVSSDPLKLQEEAGKVNIQTVDYCALAPDHDTLITKFTVNVLPVAEGLEAANNLEYVEKYRDFIAQYADEFQFVELGNRYAYNLASGKHLWKNRLGTDKIEVKVKRDSADGVQEWLFDGFDVGTITEPSTSVKELGMVIAKALAGGLPYALFEVSTSVKRGRGQSVYPSQLFVQEKNQNEQGKSKVLHSTKGIAAQTEQKIGNAIRTIDTWYQGSEEYRKAIAVEVYGAVKEAPIVFRSPASKTDYHSLMIQMTNGNQITDDDRHYLVAMMIRGGVLGTAKNK